jgi:hypothetical protein
MPIQQEFEHARHDKEVAALLQQKKHYDWVVVVSFYSALHFVRGSLFPFKPHAETFNTFEEYYLAKKNEYRAANKGKPIKHDLLVSLVVAQLNAIAEKYNWLYDAANTIRYDDNAIDQADANKALLYLTAIESTCCPPATPPAPPAP